jgi:hypothetical protein
MRFTDFSIEECFVPRNNAGENGKSALGIEADTGHVVKACASMSGKPGRRQRPG